MSAKTCKYNHVGEYYQLTNGQWRCRQCRRESDARYRAECADAIRERRSAARRSTHGRAMANAYNKEWKRKNPERTRQWANAWKTRNPDKVAATKRRYRTKNPEVHREQRIRRRARLRGATGQVTQADHRRLMARYNSLCAYCGLLPATTIDHVIPLVRGGRHTIGNLLPACRPCNSQKNRRTIIEWKTMPRTKRWFQIVHLFASGTFPPTPVPTHA